MTKKKATPLFLLVFWLFFSWLPFYGEGLAFSSIQWDLADVQRGQLYVHELVVQNASQQTADLSFVSSCSCLSLSRYEMRLEPGEKGLVELAYHSSDEAPGPFEKFVVIESNLSGYERLFYPVSGNVVTVDILVWILLAGGGLGIALVLVIILKARSLRKPRS